MGNRPQDTGSNFSTQMTTNRHGSGVFTGMVSQVNQLPINNIRNSVPNLEQRCNPVMAMGSQMAQPQYPSNQVQQQTCSSNQQNTQIFTGEAQTGGLSQGQGGLGQQLQMAGNELPNNRQGEQQHLIPSLHALKTTAVNQDLVQRRLNELQQQAVPQPTGNANNFIQQGLSGSTSNPKKNKKEKVEVVWPQVCVFVGHLRSRVTYEQLTQSQFVLGYLRSVQDEENPLIRSNMVEYLTELFQNVCDYGWQAAKGAHLVVMTKMEDGLVTWGDLKRVNKIRKTYVRSTGTSNNYNNTDINNPMNKKVGKKPSSMPCKDFQEGRCTKQQDPDVGLITHKHICAYCLYTLNKMYGHSESVCNNKKRSRQGQNQHSYPQQ